MHIFLTGKKVEGKMQGRYKGKVIMSGTPVKILYLMSAVLIVEYKFFLEAFPIALERTSGGIQIQILKHCARVSLVFLISLAGKQVWCSWNCKIRYGEDGIYFFFYPVSFKTNWHSVKKSFKKSAFISKLIGANIIRWFRTCLIGQFKGS